MSISRYKGLIFMLGLLAVQGCSHGSVNQNVDKTISQETQVKDSGGLDAEVAKDIASDPDLTADQRAKLSTLLVSSQAQMDSLRHQSLHLRSALADEVLSPQYKPKEIAELKSRVKDTEEKKLELAFKSVDQANAILGHRAASHPKIFHHMFRS